MPTASCAQTARRHVLLPRRPGAFAVIRSMQKHTGVERPQPHSSARVPDCKVIAQPTQGTELSSLAPIKPTSQARHIDRRPIQPAHPAHRAGETVFPNQTKPTRTWATRQDCQDSPRMRECIDQPRRASARTVSRQVESPSSEKNTADEIGTAGQTRAITLFSARCSRL